MLKASGNDQPHRLSVYLVPASRYTADMSKHAFLGTDPSLKASNREYGAEL